MKRIFCLGLVFFLVAAGMAFGQVQVKNGVYFAQDPSFAPDNGWKEQVVITVAGGKITKAVYNAVSNLGVADKKTYAAAGRYGMKKASKLGLEWDQEAATLEAYLVKTQNVGFNQFKPDGTTDAISGATFHVKNFFTLVNKALASAPVQQGIYAKDGWYFAEEANFDAHTGWKDNILLTVVNGRIVDALWNSTNKDPKMKSKLVESLAGHYGLEKAAKQGPWHQQAAAVEAAIVAAQDPSKIAVKPDGTTDAISGASIHVTAVGLAAQALKAAR